MTQYAPVELCVVIISQILIRNTMEILSLKVVMKMKSITLLMETATCVM